MLLVPSRPQARCHFPSHLLSHKVVVATGLPPLSRLRSRVRKCQFEELCVWVPHKGRHYNLRGGNSSLLHLFFSFIGHSFQSYLLGCNGRISRTVQCHPLVNFNCPEAHMLRSRKVFIRFSTASLIFEVTPSSSPALSSIPRSSSISMIKLLPSPRVLLLCAPFSYLCLLAQVLTYLSLCSIAGPPNLLTKERFSLASRRQWLSRSLIPLPLSSPISQGNIHESEVMVQVLVDLLDIYLQFHQKLPKTVFLLPSLSRTGLCSFAFFIQYFTPFRSASNISTLSSKKSTNISPCHRSQSIISFHTLVKVLRAVQTLLLCTLPRSKPLFKLKALKESSFSLSEK